METITEPAREIPVVRQVDVLVAGGGPAGVGAAISAARHGARTLLVERYGFLGGMATAGLVAEFIRPKSGSREMEGLFSELLDGLKELGGVPEDGFIKVRTWGRICHVLPFDPEVLKHLLDRMMEEAKVELLFHTLAVDAIRTGRKVKGIVIENKQGRQAILAENVIDATADGDIAAYAGAKFEIGRPKDHLQMAVSQCFKVGGVKIPPDYVTRTREGLSYGKHQRYGYVTEREGVVFHVPITALRVDGTNPWDLTRAETAGRKQAREKVLSQSRSVPGFEDAYVLQTAPQVGVRSTRRILGDYVLTEQDVLSGRKFKDGIAQASFYCDTFEPDRPEVTHKYLEKRGDWYSIPYRCLLPKGIDNLLVAGRCISADYYAEASLRLMHTCMALGEAAGAAAALACRKGIPPRQVTPGQLKRMLVACSGRRRRARAEARKATG